MTMKDCMVDDMLKVLECAICLQTIKNPRRLVCDHSFCKTCLDKLIEFNDDGSFTIKCPKQCEKHTVLPYEKTTNDLGVDYMMKGMLDVILEYNKKNGVEVDLKRPKCQLNADCNRNVKNYCPTCYIHFCTSCICYCQNKNDYIPVSMNDDDGLEVLCAEHLTKASYLCCDPCQNKFICLYCTKRDHNNHLHDTVNNLFNKIKDDLNKEIDSVDQYNNKITRILHNYANDASATKFFIQEILKRRKLLCLKWYIEFLNDEETILLSDLDILLDNLKHQFKKKNLIMHRYEKIATQTGVSFVIPALDLINSCINKDEEKEIFERTISLSDFQFNSKSPLGKLVTKDLLINSMYENTYLKFMYDDNEVSKDNLEQVLNKGFPEIQETHDDIYEKLKELRLQDDTGDKIQVISPSPTNTAIHLGSFATIAEEKQKQQHQKHQQQTVSLASLPPQLIYQPPSPVNQQIPYFTKVPLQRATPMGYQHKIGPTGSKNNTSHVVPHPSAYMVSLPQQMQYSSMPGAPSQNRNTFVHPQPPPGLNILYPFGMQYPRQPQQSATRLFNQTLNHSHLVNLPPQKQKEVLAEKLFPLVERKECNVQEAAVITRVLIQKKNMDTLLQMLISEELLKKEIDMIKSSMSRNSDESIMK